jgi:hypothetical protein
MDNVQNCDSYINIPSSQTYRSLAFNVLVLHITKGKARAVPYLDNRVYF